MKAIPDGTVDMILCDPPFGTTACKWDTVIPFEPLWEQYWRVLKPNGVVALFGAEPFSSNLRMSQIQTFKYDWVWYKNTQTGISIAKIQPMRAHEIISVFYKQQCTYNRQPAKSRIENIETREGKIRHRKGKSDHTPKLDFQDDVFKSAVNPRSVLEFNVVNNANGAKLHPTQKPIALLEYLIRTYTNEAETVLDNCMGSGSTGVAAVNLKRRFIGIELDAKYFGIAERRITEADTWGPSHKIGSKESIRDYCSLTKQGI